MGGCASKPKELDGPNSEVLPPETKADHDQPSTNAVEGEAPAEVKSEEAKESKEQPLVDLLSEPIEAAAAPQEPELKAEAEEIKVAEKAEDEAAGATEKAAAEEHPLQEEKPKN